MRGIARHWWALALVALAASAPLAQAAQIRDEAGMFGEDAKAQAERELTKFEREYQVPVQIETMNGLRNRGESAAENRRKINLEAVERDRAWGNKGIFILIDKRDHLISEPLVPGWLAHHVPEGSRRAIREQFIAGFRKNDFDAGLVNGVKQIGEELSAAHAEAGGPLRRPMRQPGPAGGPPVARRGLPGPAGPVAPQQMRRGTGIAPWIGIFLVIFGIFLVIRLLGSLFGGARRGGGVGGPGYGGAPGMGGGYGYGGGGGGFWQSMLGGIGGAMAGNWLYDRFSGRHYESGGGYHEAGAGPYESGGTAGPADDEIVGANDDGGQGGDWGGGGGGGGDWGGGGGGDWGGGGGGDWGGGGGDGGGGGGDW